MNPDICATCTAPLVTQNAWKALDPSRRATATNDGYRRKAAHGICCRCYERETRSPEGRAARDEAKRIRAERLEDLRWMAWGGECLAGAARRLGVSVEALEKFLRDEPALLRTLTRRNPRDHNRATHIEVAIAAKRAKREQREQAAA